jgi:hypothetical protein
MDGRLKSELLEVHITTYRRCDLDLQDQLELAEALVERLRIMQEVDEDALKYVYGGN